MSIALGIVVIALIGVLWLYSMYVSWIVSQGISVAPATTREVGTVLEKIERMVRKWRYSSLFIFRKLYDRLLKHTATIFVKIFPKSAPVFVKRDALTGLTHGPSSYFLKSISSQKKRGTLASK